MADFSWAPDEIRSLLFYEDKKLYIGCSKCDAKRQTAGKGAIQKSIEAGRMSSLMYCRVHGGKSGKFTKEVIDSWPKGHKMCIGCEKILPFDMFHKASMCLFGYNTHCKDCREPNSKKSYESTTIEERLINAARSRAKKKGREFSLRIRDIVIPDVCPILGVPIVVEAGHPYAPSLDRTDSSRGYTPDNVRVVSRRANVLKNNMTKEECRKILDYLEGCEIIDITK